MDERHVANEPAQVESRLTLQTRPAVHRQSSHIGSAGCRRVEAVEVTSVLIEVICEEGGDGIHTKLGHGNVVQVEWVYQGVYAGKSLVGLVTDPGPHWMQSRRRSTKGP